MFKIELECVLKDKRIVIRGSFAKLARGGRMGKFIPEKRRIACEKVAVDTEYNVFHLLRIVIDNCTILDHGCTYAEDDVSSGDVILSMARNALADCARAHGRVHDRQWLASLGRKSWSVNRRGERYRREKKKLGDSWEER